ncbi:MAG: hypothetical protein L0Y67_07090 [Gammaproteobacteria bacterium]|nr:hypothetical protein [Gammaproteobacteria bacterium]
MRYRKLTPFTGKTICLTSVLITGGTRYLIPAIPLYLFYAFVGINAVSRQQRIEGLIFSTLLMAIAVAYAAQYSRLDYGPIREGIAKRETQEFFEYVKQGTRVDDIFIFRKPRALALFTGRSASAWHQPQDDQNLWNYLEQIHATHLALGPKYLEPADQEYLQRFIDRYRDRLEEMYTNADFKVYKIKN